MKLILSFFSTCFITHVLCLLFFILTLVFFLPPRPVFATSESDSQDSILQQKGTSESEQNNKDIFGHSKTEKINLCVADVGFGPLRLKSQSPFQSLRMGITPLAPSTITKSEWEFFLAGTLANVWANGEGDYMLDYETSNIQMSIAYGMTQTFKLEIGYEEQRYFGGILDGFIIAFHDTFGIDQTGRDKAPQGQVNMEINDSDGNTVYYESESSIYSRGLLLTLQQNVTCGTERFPAFSYALTLRQELEYPNVVDRSNPYDFGISLATSRRFSNFYLYY
jgi:hypothetical protein